MTDEKRERLNSLGRKMKDHAENNSERSRETEEHSVPHRQKPGAAEDSVKTNRTR